MICGGKWWCGGIAGRARVAQETEGKRSRERRGVCEGNQAYGQERTAAETTSGNVDRDSVSMVAREEKDDAGKKRMGVVTGEWCSGGWW